MLGNFSFGDYFKKEAIAYAWELVTSPEWFGIDKSKLYATVFGGAEVSPGNTLGVDEEAKKFWLEQKVPADRIFEISGLKENFWAMGDTGPCGPCSELHYDMGPAASELGHGTTAPECKFPCDCGRYVEIWNLVFMQFNRFCELERSGGQHTFEDISAALGQNLSVHEYKKCLQVEPLPKPCVDTGMGLERTAATLLNLKDPTKNSNYDTDLFTPLIKRAAELLNRKPLTDSSMRVVERTKQRLVTEADDIQPSYRVIADHSRAATFLISDGVVPSNEGRGYVLRKIIRRALLHVRSLGGDFPFLSGVADAVREEMQQAYPELYAHAQVVQRVLDEEERRFAHTLEIGVKKAYQALAEHLVPIFQASRQLLHELNAQLPSGQKKDQEDEEMAKRLCVGTDEQLHEAVRYVLFRLKGRGFWRMFPGEKAFQLYDTYGVQRDLIEVIMRDLGATVNWAGFEKAMQEQRNKARASWKGGAKEAANPAYAKLAETFKTEPDFYHGTSAKDCRIETIITKSGSVKELKAGESGE